MLNIKPSEKKTTEKIAAFTLIFVAGFMLADTSIAGAASFADISLAGALNLPMSAAVLMGSMIKSVISGALGKNIVKISAIIMIVIMKMFFEPESDPKLCGIWTAMSIILSGAAVSAIIGEVLYKLLFYVFYGVSAGFTAYSAALIIKGLRYQPVMDLSSSSGCAYAVVYTIFISAVCSIKLRYIEPGIIIGSAVTLLAAYNYRRTGGVLCGALTTCGAFLSSPECGMTVVLLPAAGLITGYLYKQKYTVAAVAFAGVNFMLTVLTGITQNGIYSMLNIMIGTILFTVISPKFSDKWVITGSNFTSALPEIMSSRMGFLSASIETVRNESEKIAEMLSKSAENQSEIEENSREVCEHCFRKLACRKTDHDITMRGFRKLSQLTEISREMIPYELEECLHKEELIEVFERSRREKAVAKILEMRFAESRRLLSEQIKIIEEIVETAGKCPDVRYSEPVSKAVRDKLVKFGSSPDNVIACYNSRNRLLIELYFSFNNAPDSHTRICDLISDDLRIPLSCTEPVHSGKEVRLRLFERPEYAIEVYGASVCAESSGENGDTSIAFGDGTGVSYVILSDGMGSGRNAAIQSRMVVSMFRKLISSGVNYASAIRLINSIMLTKSRDEAFATLDAVRIDPDNCRLTIIKSGASATLIRHRGNVMKVTSSTFPIGIYEQSDTFSGNYDFEEGDIIIMFSDGICENEYRFIKELLLGGDDVKKIVDEICAKSEIFNPSLHADDVTVIGIRAVRSSEKV